MAGQEMDFIIRNGLVVDGNGGEPFIGQVAVGKGKIAAVDRNPDLPDRIPVVDAAGLVVCPGFIDTHSHSDLSLFSCPDANSALHQGVTTEVIGNCGLSVFPVAGPTSPQLKDYLALLGDRSDRPVQWTDLEGYAGAVAADGLGINIAPLIGHGSLRIAVMGFDARPATEDELAAMVRLLERDLEQGAFGLSSGLVYPPGINAGMEEMVRLTVTVENHQAIYATHLRGDTLRSAPSLVNSLAEGLDVSRRTGVRLHVSHAPPKFPNTGAAGKMIEMMDNHRRLGLEVSCDAHPYLAAMTFLASLLPSWVFEGGQEAARQRFRDPAQRARVMDGLAEITGHLDGADFWPRNQVLLPDPSQPLNGLRLDEIARRTGMEAAEALIDLLDRGGERLFEIEVLQWIYSAEETRRMYAWPRTMVGADGLTSDLETDLGGLTAHPRSWGTFPKFLIDYHRHTDRLSLAEAIRRMTGLPATTFGLSDRGRLKPGLAADIAVLDLAGLEDAADYDRPRAYARGVRHLWVNGLPVLENGRRTGQRPGRVLRKTP